MLKVERTCTSAQHEEIQKESALVFRAESLLGEREAKIFPPDHLIPAWQIYLRHSEITTNTHYTFAGALKDLIEQLEKESARCPHDRLNEDGICRRCGEDRRGV